MLDKVIELHVWRSDMEILRPAEPPPARPLFATSVPAGFLSPADDYIEGHLDLNAYFLRHPSATFYLCEDLKTDTLIHKALANQ
jgi:SOS-response transcriptional repressor LexA